MKCPHCGHGHNLHAGSGATTIAPGTCRQRNDGAPECECPGWIPEVQTPRRIVNLRQYRTPRPTGPEWISPLDERGDYSGWDDAA